MPDPDLGLLTPLEHRALSLSGELANTIREIIGKGPTAEHDWAEAAGLIHQVQHFVLAQAAARAYPNLYRLAGQTLRENVFVGVPTFVAIPTLGESDLLWEMLPDLERDPGVLGVWVLDNAHGDPDRPLRIDEQLDSWHRGPSKVLVIDAHGMGIYAMWNWAIQRARDRFPDGAYVAILNDDLVIEDRTVGQLAATLDADPTLAIVSPDYDLDALPLEGMETPRVQYCHGTYRSHGISGSAFMVRAESCPLVDEQFEWWGGDDDLVLSIEKAGGRAGIVRGLPVRHESSTTANRHAWTQEAAGRDRERFAAKWGEERAW